MLKREQMAGVPSRPGRGVTLIEARHLFGRGKSLEEQGPRDRVFFLADCDAGGGGHGGCLVRRIKVGQKWLNAIIDTGATINLLGERRLETVCPCQSVQTSDTRIYPYGSCEPLPTVGTVVVEVRWDRQRLFVEFQVVRGKTDTIIGYTTAVVFGLVTVTRPWRQDEDQFEEQNGPEVDHQGAREGGYLRRVCRGQSAARGVPEWVPYAKECTPRLR